MTRNLKALALALAIVFALGAITAGAASAHEYRSSVTLTTLTGETLTTEKFYLNGLGGKTAVECPKAKYDGTTTGSPSQNLFIKPTDITCNTFQANDTHVKFNDCGYIYEFATDANGHAQVTPICKKTPTIEIQVTNVCTFTVTSGEQTGVHYTNIAGNPTTHFVVETTIEKIKYTKAGPFCLMLEGDGTNGAWEGAYTLKGYEDLDDKPQADQYTPGATKEGKEVDVWVE